MYNTPFAGEILCASSLGLRQKVAREAANLLYSGAETEYKQAKTKAARIFGTGFFPTNLEVAEELDKIAEANEGLSRQVQLVLKRKEAFQIMKLFTAYNAHLVGSVWRGTAHHSSDIDIVLEHDEPNDILKVLKQNDVRILRAEWIAVTKEVRKKESYHVYLQSPTKETIELIVRSHDEAKLNGKCEIYGDKVTGLNMQDLEEVLENDPMRRFVPF